ncbi:hypothetical protein BH23CHL10_BH23CHL10_09930 [soil metagenome]
MATALILVLSACSGEPTVTGLWRTSSRNGILICAVASGARSLSGTRRLIEVVHSGSVPKGAPPLAAGTAPRGPAPCPGPASLRGVRLEASETLGNRAEDRNANVRELVHQRMELAMADDEQSGDPIGNDGGRAGPPIEQGDLAEEVATGKLGDFPLAVEHAEPPVEDDEELVPDVSLFGQDLVKSDLDLIGQLSEAFKLTLSHMREQGYLPQMIELLIT